MKIITFIVLSLCAIAALSKTDPLQLEIDAITEVIQISKDLAQTPKITAGYNEADRYYKGADPTSEPCERLSQLSMLEDELSMSASHILATRVLQVHCQ